MAPLPLILLTGFLGAGKTTLLLRWLRESPATGRRLGVVMNEFGAESVDSQLVGRPGLPLQQVAGGCICCAPDNELPNAVTRLVKSGECDFLVVETSGLADPDNVIDALTDHDLLPHVRLQAVVTVVDAVWYARPGAEAGERVLARKQIQFAHVLCLSKCDRLDAAEIIAVEAEMRRLNPRAQLVKLPFGLPEVADLLARPAAQVEIEMAKSGARAADTDGNTGSGEPVPPEGKSGRRRAEDGDEKSDGGTPHLHTTYQSVTWCFPVPVERSKFEAFLSQLEPKEVVRAKGFVRFLRQPEKLFLFQTVWGHHVIDEFPAKPHPEPVAVLIGPQLDPEKYRARLRALVFGNAAALRVTAAE